MSDTTKIHSQYKQAIVALVAGGMSDLSSDDETDAIIEALKAREDWWRADSDEMMVTINAALTEVARLTTERDAALADAERLRMALDAVEDCLMHTYNTDGTRIEKALAVTTDALSDGETDGAS